MLAREIGADLFVVDDKYASRVAKSLGLRVTGLIGVLFEGTKKKLMSKNESRKSILALAGTKFSLSSVDLIRILDQLEAL